jgi:hypothetical protein
MVRQLQMQSPGAIHHVMNRFWIAAHLEMGVPATWRICSTGRTERNQPVQILCSYPFPFGVGPVRGETKRIEGF